MAEESPSNNCCIIFGYIATLALGITILVFGCSVLKSSSNPWISLMMNGSVQLAGGVVAVVAGVEMISWSCGGVDKSSLASRTAGLFVILLLAVATLSLSILMMQDSKYSGSLEKAPNRGYVEYRFDSFSSRLRGRVSDVHRWNGITACLGIVDGPCADLKRAPFDFSSAKKLYAANLSPLQSGCCIPPRSCNFTFVSPTKWTPTINQTTALDSDCARWNNDQHKLCLDCDSCKAGVLLGFADKFKKPSTALVVSSAIAVTVVFLLLIVVCVDLVVS